MAKKRKHHSMRKKMHHLYREADKMDRDMYMAYDRRGHVMGEHYGEETRYAHGRNMRGDYFSDDHPAEGPRGFRPREIYGETFKDRMDLNDKRRIMQANNGRMAPITEDFSKPCGIPYGAISRDVGNGDYYSMNAYRVGDLFEQVDATMRQDAAAIKSITKPTNW
jgi:hypothetical protein